MVTDSNRKTGHFENDGNGLSALTLIGTVGI